MKEKVNSLNDRDLEILDILGFDFNNESDLPSFLAKTIETVEETENIRSLHDQGIALRSVRMILKKINPDHRIFIVNRKQQKPAPCFPIFF